MGEMNRVRIKATVIQRYSVYICHILWYRIIRLLWFGKCVILCNIELVTAKRSSRNTTAFIIRLFCRIFFCCCPFFCSVLHSTTSTRYPNMKRTKRKRCTKSPKQQQQQRQNTWRWTKNIKWENYRLVYDDVCMKL